MNQLLETITTIGKNEKLDSELYNELVDTKEQLIVDKALESDNKDVLKAVLRNSLIPKEIIDKYSFPISDYTIAILHNDIVLNDAKSYDEMVNNILEKIIEHFNGKKITSKCKDDVLDWGCLLESIGLFFYCRGTDSNFGMLEENIARLIIMFAESGNSYEEIYSGDMLNSKGCFLGICEEDINYAIMKEIADLDLLKRAYKTGFFHADAILSNDTWTSEELIEIFEGLEDYEGYDIIGIIQNKNTPREILIKLADDEDEEISELAQERL